MVLDGNLTDFPDEFIVEGERDFHIHSVSENTNLRTFRGDPSNARQVGTGIWRATLHLNKFHFIVFRHRIARHNAILDIQFDRFENVAKCVARTTV